MPARMKESQWRICVPVIVLLGAREAIAIGVWLVRVYAPLNECINVVEIPSDDSPTTRYVHTELCTHITLPDGGWSVNEARGRWKLNTIDNTCN